MWDSHDHIPQATQTVFIELPLSAGAFVYKKHFTESYS